MHIHRSIVDWTTIRLDQVWHLRDVINCRSKPSSIASRATMLYRSWRLWERFLAS